MLVGLWIISVLLAIASLGKFDRLPGILRIRNFCEVWGPVARLPNISEVSSHRSEARRLPRLRREEDGYHRHYTEP